MPGSLGIVGYGAFGTLIHTLVQCFAPQVAVKVFSSRKDPDGKTFFTLEEVSSCDAVVLSVPIRFFEETVVKILPFVRPETVLVDIATVKVHTVEVLKRLAGDRKYIAAHPMWGPESYKKKNENVQGFRIIVSESTIPTDQKNVLIDSLQGIGFVVVEMNAEDHDKHLAESLFLTHYVGQIISKGGFNRGAIDTVSFGYLMDAMESVRHDTQLFEDVFRFNPYCKEVIERFEKAEKEVRNGLVS